MRILRKLLGRTPWWVLVAHAVVCAVLALHLHQSILNEYETRANAAVAPPPRPIDLTMFRRDRDIHVAGEVNLNAQVDQNRVLAISDAAGEAVYLIGLLGSTGRVGDAPDAAMIMGQQEFDGVQSYIERNFLSDGRVGPRVSVGGLVRDEPDLQAVMAAELAKTNQVLPKDFFLLDPFILPRVVILAPLPTFYWLLPVLPLILMILFARSGIINWLTTPVGMFVSLKARQRWRRLERAAGVKPLSAARTGNTVLFNPFVWYRNARILNVGARRIVFRLMRRCAACNRFASNWIVDQAEARRDGPDAFAKLGEAAAKPLPRKDYDDFFVEMHKRKRRAS